MVTKRFELRLDDELMRNLERTAAEECVSVSEIARRFLGIGYEDWLKARRKVAVKRISEMAIEAMPDPDELNQQLDSTYDVDLP